MFTIKAAYAALIMPNPVVWDKPIWFKGRILDFLLFLGLHV